MVVDGGHRNGEIIAPGASTQLTVREPCRIVYGLECWRILVRYRTAAHRAEIQAQIRHTNARPGLEPEYLMIEFRNESNESTVDKGAADKVRLLHYLLGPRNRLVLEQVLLPSLIMRTIFYC